MERLVLALSMVVLAMVAGCARSGGSTGATLATYEKTGGFAGFDTRLTVRDDGTLILQDRKAKQTLLAAAEPALLLRLRMLAESPEAERIASAYPPPSGGADLLTYEFRVVTPRGERATRTTDAASHPQVVSDLIAILDQLWAQARTGKPE